MAKVKDIYDFLDLKFPYCKKEKDDNSGLIAGDFESEVKKVLVSLDLTYEVIKEAQDKGVSLIVTHHPAVFEGLMSIDENSYAGGKISKLIKSNISAISCHTNLDIAKNGLNDMLSNVLGLENIGCFCEVPELPNEFIGRIGYFEPFEPTDLITFANFVKKTLNCEGLRYCDAGRLVQKVAVIGGSGAYFASEAVKAGADTFVTGDAKYKDFIVCKETGLNLIAAGHFNTENIVVKPLAELIKKAFPSLIVSVSEVHKNCISFI